MIITIQGYNGKKSKATQTACVLAGMLALKQNSNTLLLQCINNDINSVENILCGKGLVRKFGDESTDFTDNGIDALLRSVGNLRVGKEEFEKYCTALITIKNRLDITNCSKTKVFNQTLLSMEDSFSNILTGANEIYDNVIILGPSDSPEVTEMINKYADLSLYTITQGHKATGKAFGKNIAFVVTDYEVTSSINMSAIRKDYKPAGFFKKANVYKLSRNVAVRDAAITGTLLRYIRDNRECGDYEANFEWHQDVDKLLKLMTGLDPEDADYSWEVLEDGTYEYGDLSKEALAAKKEELHLAIEPKKQGFFARLFGKQKATVVVEQVESEKSIPKAITMTDLGEKPDAPIENFDFDTESESLDVEQENSENSVVDDLLEDETGKLADEVETMADEENVESQVAVEVESQDEVPDPKPKPVKKTVTKSTTATKKSAASTAKKTTTKKTASKESDKPDDETEPVVKKRTTRKKIEAETDETQETPVKKPVRKKTSTATSSKSTATKSAKEEAEPAKKTVRKKTAKVEDVEKTEEPVKKTTTRKKVEKTADAEEKPKTVKKATVKKITAADEEKPKTVRKRVVKKAVEEKPVSETKETAKRTKKVLEVVE
jgi:hypothetical protein